MLILLSQPTDTTYLHHRTELNQSAEPDSSGIRGFTLINHTQVKKNQVSQHSLPVSVHLNIRDVTNLIIVIFCEEIRPRYVKIIQKKHLTFIICNSVLYLRCSLKFKF